MPMERLPRGLTQKPRVTRDELEVMRDAEAVQQAAILDFETWRQSNDERDFKLAQLGFAKAQTLWAQATFYGTVG